MDLEAIQCIERGLDEYGSSSPSVVDGSAVSVVQRKYSAPRTLPWEREPVGAAVSAPGNRVNGSLRDQGHVAMDRDSARGRRRHRGPFSLAARTTCTPL